MTLRNYPALLFNPATELDGRSTVLVVDDQPDVRQAMADVIEQIGYRPVPLASGMAALDHVVGGHAADAAIIDFLMPGMKGPEAARALRALRPDIAILLVSGHPDMHLADTLLAKVQMLRKPFRIAQLEAGLDEALAMVRPPALH